MMLILEGIVFAYAAGLLVLLAGLKYAPEGFQDAEGFHIHWRNNTPEIRDVACVWLTAQPSPV
jgi:hypothetical protein